MKNASEIPKVGVYYQYGAFSTMYKHDSNGIMLGDDECFECYMDGKQIEQAEDMDYWNDDDWEEREEEVDY